MISAERVVLECSRANQIGDEDQTMTLAMEQTKSRAIMVLAMREARKVVERQLRSQCRRLCDVEYREIMQMAKGYFDEHPAELIAQVKAIVDLWASQGRFGPRGGFR
jgi:HJR/Mrr/RecB family endonuclease